MPEVSQWEKALDEWLEPFLAALGHKVRCRWAPVYLRGLFGRTERKSVQPMAAELTPDDYDQLHNFVASPAWDTAPLEEILAAKADALVGGDDAVLIIDGPSGNAGGGTRHCPRKVRTRSAWPPSMPVCSARRQTVRCSFR